MTDVRSRGPWKHSGGPVDFKGTLRSTSVTVPKHEAGVELFYDPSQPRAYLAVYDRSSNTPKPLEIQASGLTLPTDSITRSLVNYSLGSDAWTNVGLSASDNAIAGVPTWSVTTDADVKYLLISLNASVQIVSGAASSWCGFALYNSGASIIRFPPTFCDSSTLSTTTGVSGGAQLYVPTPSTSYTFQLRFYCSNTLAAGAYLRAASAPTTEFLTFQVIEVRA